MGAESSTMQTAASTCKGCKNLGNKQVDTVKLDMEKFRDASLTATAAAGKENSDPGQMRESLAAQKNEHEKQQRLKEAEEFEEARRRAFEEAEERVRQFELAEFLKKQKEEEEAAERRRIAAEEEEAARRRVEVARITEEKRQQAEEEERLRRIQKEEEEEEERLLKQIKEEDEEAFRRQAEQEEEEARKKQRLEAFLSKAGFAAVTDKKVKKGIISSGFSYPLHAAVEQKDAEAIELLLRAGADPCLANSKKLTPLKLAYAKNKQGSHDKVIAALAA